MFTHKPIHLWRRLLLGVISIYLLSIQTTLAQSVETAVANPTFQAFLPLALQQSEGHGKEIVAAAIPIHGCYLEIVAISKPAVGDLVARSFNNYEISEFIIEGVFPRGELWIELATPSGNTFRIKPVGNMGSNVLTIPMIPGQLEKWKESGVYRISVGRDRTMCPPLISSKRFAITMEVEKSKDSTSTDSVTGTWRSTRQ